MAVTPNSIITPQTPKAAAVVTTTANTTYTSSPTNTQQLLVAGPNGGRLTRLRSTPRASANTAVQLYLSVDGGTSKLLIDSVLVNVTISTTSRITPADWGYSEDTPLILPAAAILYVAQSLTIADGITTVAEWADY
ncbi:hypothetical protein [Phenylobacterium sp.]|jgi:hypothetical protein|uniref:hypothetical protein n=1 Tax=Phenylobacterium sp. TaxID=1871053 RepID=UPI003783B581